MQKKYCVVVRNFENQMSFRSPPFYTISGLIMISNRVLVEKINLYTFTGDFLYKDSAASWNSCQLVM